MLEIMIEDEDKDEDEEGRAKVDVDVMDCGKRNGAAESKTSTMRDNLNGKEFPRTKETNYCHRDQEDASLPSQHKWALSSAHLNQGLDNSLGNGAGTRVYGPDLKFTGRKSLWHKECYFLANLLNLLS